MTVYLFPGQGSQLRGMGAGLFDAFSEMTEHADDILGYSVKSLCRDDPERKLKDTRYTQPAIFVVNALSFQKKMTETQILPSAVAGHSLGEYNALHAAGAIGFGDALALVKKRGELMSQAESGAMAAILGIDAAAVQACLEQNDLLAIDIANYNAPLQTVISGPKDDIRRAEAAFAAIGATFVRLNTTGAFHSRYMAPAQAAFQAFIGNSAFAEPGVPVISNVYAVPHQPSKIADTLAKQITHSVNWFQSMQYLFESGEREFEELGPGNVLTKLLAKNLDHYNASRAVPAYAMGSVEPENTYPTAVATDHARQTQVGGGAQTARMKVDDWNKRYAAGTRVRVEGYDGDLETRTQAVILFGHRAAIYMKDYKGYFALDEVTPIFDSVTE